MSSLLPFIKSVFHMNPEVESEREYDECVEDFIE